MRMLICVLGIAAVSIAAVAQPIQKNASPPASRLDAVVDRAIADKRIVGVVVLVARDGKIVYRRAAGLADREAGRPMREDAIFRLASVSKPIVAATFMRLVEQHKLNLDAPVTQWLTDFRPHLSDGTTPVITLHQLLTHTSGLSYRFEEPAGSDYHRLNISDGLDQPGLSLDENLHRLTAATLGFTPGTKWHYSLGIDVLGAVIASARGQSLPQAVQDLLTAPLGMIDTGFAVTDPARVVTPYADGKPEPVRMADGEIVPFAGGFIRYAPSRAFNKASYPSGGAGMVGTAGDFLRFLEIIRTQGAPILKSETVRTMMTDQVGAQAETQGPGWGFGYGWAVLDDPIAAATPQSKGTIQWGGAYGQSWFVDPVRKLTVIAFTNTAIEGMSGEFPKDIRDAVYGK